MPDRIVEGEVVEPGPDPEKRPEPSGGKTFFHPASGALILAVDWAAFGLDLASGFAGLLVLSLLAGVGTFYGVLLIQRRLHGDKPGPAAMKALIGALAAGVPFPIAGTLIGGAIIALSGLPSLPGKK